MGEFPIFLDEDWEEVGEQILAVMQACEDSHAGEADLLEFVVAEGIPETSQKFKD